MNNLTSNQYLAGILNALQGTLTVSGGAGGSSGSVTAAGVNGTFAQAIQGITGGIPVPITGTISATNPSVSTTGTGVPAYATAIGWQNGSGNLVIPSTANPLPVSLASVPLPTGAATSALQTTISGQLPTSLGAKTTANSLAVNIASDQTLNPSVSTTGTGVPAYATAIGWQNGSGNLVIPSTANPLPVSLASVPLPTGAATSALQTTISGQLPTSLGAKTTANSLAVNIASDQTLNLSVSTTGTGVPASATAIGWQNGSGNLVIPSAANPLPVITASTADINVAGTTLNANDAVTITNSQGLYNVGIELTGASSGATHVFEGAYETSPTNWWTIPITPLAGGAPVTSITANGQWVAPVGGFQQVRLRRSVAGTGSASVVLNGSIGQQLVNASIVNFPAIVGSATGGTAAASSQLGGGIYNVTAPTLTTGQQASTQLDVNGNVLVNASNQAINIASSGIMNPYVSGSTGYNLAAVNNTNTVQVTPGQTVSIAIGNPNFIPLGSYSAVVETSATPGGTYAGVNVRKLSTIYDSAPLATISHANNTLSNTPITSNALTTLTNHGLSTGQVVYFGVATATQGAYIPGVYGPLVTAVSLVTGVFTCTNNFVNGQPIYFSQVTATGFSANTYYYVSNVTGSSFNISANLGGPAIIPTAWTSCLIASLFAGNPYYVTSTPTTTTFTVGSTPGTTIQMFGCPILGAGAVNGVAAVSALAGNVITTSTAHGYVANQPIVFSTPGSITGISANTIYYVSVVSPTTFSVSATSGGGILTLGGAFTGATIITAGQIQMSSVASGVVTTASAHGFAQNQPVQFSNVGSLTGISISTTYYAACPTSTTFTLAATPGGPAIALGSTLGSPIMTTTGITVATLGVGNYLYTVPQGITGLRVRCSAISGNSNFFAFIDNWSTSQNNTINIGFQGGSSLPSAYPVIPLITSDSLTDISIDVSTLSGTSQTINGYHSADPVGPFQDVETLNIFSSVGTIASNFTGVGAYRYQPKLKYFRNILVYAANLGFEVNGVNARTGQVSNSDQAAVNTVGTVTNLATINSKAPAYNAGSGAGLFNAGVVLGNMATLAAVASTSYVVNTATGKALVTAIDNGNAFDLFINVTVAPTSAGYLNIIVQDSFDGATSYLDSYHCEPILISTSAGKYVVRDIPMFSGKFQFVITTNAVSAISATLNVVPKNTALVFTRQYFDQKAIVCTTSLSQPAVFNYGTWNTAAGTTIATPWNYQGCKSLTLEVKSSYYFSGTTTSPVYGIYLSPTGNTGEWYDSGLNLPVTAANTMFGATLTNQGAFKYATPYIKTAAAGTPPAIASFATTIFTTTQAHQLSLGQIVVFNNIGSITGLTANTYYYVTVVGSTTTFSLAASYGGAAITPGGTVGAATIAPVTQFYALLRGQA
jgi:hypothetical protein